MVRHMRRSTDKITGIKVVNKTNLMLVACLKTRGRLNFFFLLHTTFFYGFSRFISITPLDTDDSFRTQKPNVYICTLYIESLTEIIGILVGNVMILIANT